MIFADLKCLGSACFMQLLIPLIYFSDLTMSKRTHSEAMETKQNILNASRKLFSEKGFHKTSLSDIAREAGVTRGAVYWHFENKNDLLVELCHEAARGANIAPHLKMAAEDGQIDPLGMLRKWVKGHFSDDAEEMFLSFLIDTMASLMASQSDKEDITDAKEKFSELLKLRRMRIEEALRNSVIRKQLPSDVDIKLVASVIEGVLFGFVAAIRHGTAVKPYSRYNTAVDMLFARLPDIKINRQ